MVVSPVEVFRTVSRIIILLCIAQSILSPVSVGKKVSRKNECIKGNDCITKDGKICCKDNETNGKIKVRGIEGKDENKMKKIKNGGNTKRKIITPNDKKSKADKIDNKNNKGVRTKMRTETKMSKNEIKGRKKKTRGKVASDKKGKQAGKLGNKDKKSKQKNKSDKTGKKIKSNSQLQKGKRKGKQAGKSGNKDSKSKQKIKSIKTDKKRKSNSQSKKVKRKGKKGENKKKKSKARKGKNKGNSPSKRKKDNNGSNGSKFKCTTITAECKALGGTCVKKGFCSKKNKSKGNNKNKDNGKRKSNGNGKNKIARMNKKKDKGKSFPCGLFCECCIPKPPTHAPCPYKPTTPECNARAGTCMMRSGCNYKTGNQIITDECDKRGTACNECCSPNACAPKDCTSNGVVGVCSKTADAQYNLEVGAQGCNGACKCHIEDPCTGGACKDTCSMNEKDDPLIICPTGKKCCKPDKPPSCKQSTCNGGVSGGKCKQKCKGKWVDSKKGCSMNETPNACFCCVKGPKCSKKCKCNNDEKGKCKPQCQEGWVDTKAGCKKEKCSGCKCCAKDCKPKTCTFMGEKGNCSAKAIPGNEDVGTQQCKGKCSCYVPIIKCGIEGPSTTRIINGEDVTGARKYSWQVGLSPWDAPDYDVFCGGSVITDKHILTAAHCYDKRSFHYIGFVSNMQNETLIIIPQAQVYIHINYTTDGTDYDIAIIELSQPIDLIKYDISPICIPSDDTNDYAGVNAIVSGWGSTTGHNLGDDYDAIYPNILQEAQVPVISYTDCLKRIDYHKEFELCAGDLTGFETGGMNICQGDSGGPLTVQDNGQYQQIGIVSYTVFGCASKGFPGVYARVTYFLDWINEKVAPEKIYTPN